MNEKTLAQALKYLDLNFSVIPVIYKEKRPVIPWKKYQKVPPTREEVLSWFKNETPLNLAVVTGRVSKLVVIDVDSYDALPDWLKNIETWIAKTSRGYHFYFRINNEYIPTTKLTKNVDLKGEGSYVLLPESIHPSGTTYKWIKFIKKLQEPASFDLVREKVLEYLRLKENETSEPLSELYKGVEEGGRNVSLTRIAGSLFADGLNDEEVYEILKVINERNIPPLPEKEVKSIVRSISKRRKFFLKEKERIVSIFMQALLKKATEDQQFAYLMKKVVSSVEFLEHSLPEKDSKFFEKEIGKILFPEVMKAFRNCKQVFKKNSKQEDQENV
ncbi:MAG: bifunctional DNA primase/polymerase [Brevinematia bacterium]